jgi:hypothetical protein
LKNASILGVWNAISPQIGSDIPNFLDRIHSVKNMPRKRRILAKTIHTNSGRKSMQRDFEANPYTPHEERVAKYLVELTGVGGGDDPIEFLITSHASLRRRIEDLKDWIKELEQEQDGG